jgi:hypothetical protein
MITLGRNLAVAGALAEAFYAGVMSDPFDPDNWTPNTAGVAWVSP